MMIKELVAIVCGILTEKVLNKIGIDIWSVKGFAIVIVIALCFVTAINIL